MTMCLKDEEKEFVENKWLLAINYNYMNRCNKDNIYSLSSVTDYEQEAIIIDSRENAAGVKILHIQFITGDILRTFVTKNMRLL